MPDFDKSLNPIIKDTSIPSQFVKVQAPLRPQDLSPGLEEYSGIDLSGKEDIFAKIDRLSQSYTREKGIPVSRAELEANRRYDAYSPLIPDMEDFAAHGQAYLKKAFNGVLKGTNLAAATVAGGFITLGGAAIAPFTGRLADIWDNQAMRALDKWNTKVDQEYLPNYYTARERDAEWYQAANWFKVNFLFDKLIKNAGFAVGAMYSGNIVNAGILRLGSVLGKAMSGLSTAANSSQAFKTFTPLLRNMSRAFSAGKNIETAKVLEMGISSIADVTTKSSEIARIAKTAGQFARFNDAVRRGVVALYSSAGEASFETIQTVNEYKENLITKYEDEFGVRPVGEDLRQIEKEAESLGIRSFMGNLALLGVTEHAQLPYLMGSTYKTSRHVANSMLGQVDDVVMKGGKYISKPRIKFGKLRQYAGAGIYVFDPKEAAQEMGQYALQVGLTNYYNKARETNDADAWVDLFLYGMTGKDERGEGVGAFVSKEGMESGILGGITGGLMQARNRYRSNKAKKNTTQQFIEDLDNAPTFKQAFIERMAAINRGIVLQQQEQDAIIDGDELEARDLRTDSMHNYLAPRIKYGRFDMVMEDISDLRAASFTEEGLAELKQQGMANINDNIQQYHERLDKLATYAQHIESLYTSMNMRYSGEILKDKEGKPVLNERGEQLRKYTPDVIDKMVYAATKVYDYDTRIPQVSAPLTARGIVVSDILSNIITNNKPNKEATLQALETINNLDVIPDVKTDLKQNLQDVIELSLRRKLFIDQLNDVRANPLNYHTDWDMFFGETSELPVDVVQRDEEGKKQPKKLNVGQEYSLDEILRKEDSSLYLAPKITVMSQTLGGEFEVKLPNGRTEFLTPEEFEKYKITDLDNTRQDMAEVLDKVVDDVLKRDEYKELSKAPVTGKLDYINSLDNKKLVDDIYKEFDSRVEEIIKKEEENKRKREAVIKEKETLDKQQKDIVNESGDVVDVPTDKDIDTESREKEDRLRDVSVMYISTITQSEGSNNEDWQKYKAEDAPPHIKKSRVFLNNSKNFSNRKNLRTMLVTPKILESLNIKGLVQLSFGVAEDTKIEDIPGALYKEGTKDVDVDGYFVASIFVEQDKSDLYFINEQGERIGKVGDEVDVNEIVFQTMPTTSLTYSNNSPRYRREQLAEVEAQSEAWRIKRQQLLSATNPEIYEFVVSRGIPIENITIVDGQRIREKNHIGGILVPEDRISTQEGLLKVSTTKSVFHEPAAGPGRNVGVRPGLTVLTYGDTLEILTNTQFGNKRAKSVYAVIKALAQELETKKTINNAYATYLRNVMYWTSKPERDNQIYIDTSTAEILIGKSRYAITEIAEKEAEITEKLANAYHIVNNKTLTKNFSKRFIEYDENLDSVEWTNYQTYLLSSKDTTGKTRNTQETPLVTSVAKPTEALPYTHKQKYATLLDMELSVKKVKKESPIPPQAPPPQQAPPVKGKEQTEEQPEVWEVEKEKFGKGDIEYTETVEDGVSIIEIVKNDTIDKYVKDDKFYTTQAIPTLTKIVPDYTTEGKTKEEVVRDYFKLMVKARLKKDKTSPPPPAPPQAPPVQESETKKTLDPKKFKPPSIDPQFNIARGQKDPDIRIKFFSEGDTTTDRKVLNKIAKSSHPLNKLAKSLMKYATGKQIKIIPDNNTGITEDGIIAAAVNYPQWIEIAEFAEFKGLGSEVTLLHEIVHGLTADFINNVGKDTKLYKEFQRLFNEAKSKMQGDWYALRNTDEFIAGLFTDAAFIDALQKVDSSQPTTFRNLLQEIFDYILSLFGIKSTNSIYKDAFAVATNILEEAHMARELMDSTTTSSYERQFAPIAGISEKVAYELVDDMTVRSFIYIFGEDKMSLFDINRITSSELFDKIKNDYINENKYSEETWPQLVKRTKEKLRTIGINFQGENSINDENNNNRDYAPEAFTTDWKKYSPFAVKIVIATLYETMATNQQNDNTMKMPNKKVSTDGQGFISVNFSKVFSTLMNNLANTTEIANIEQKLVELAKSDPNYVRLFVRLGGNLESSAIDFNKFGYEEWRLFVNFYQTFTKQKPEALIQYISGDTVTSRKADIFSAVEQAKRDWVEELKIRSSDPKSYITFDRKTKTYKFNNKNKEFPKSVPKSSEESVKFLNTLGIGFTNEMFAKLKTDAPRGRKSEQQRFFDAVSAIHTYLQKTTGLVVINSGTLQMSGGFNTIAELTVKVENPNQENTRFNLEGNRTQNFENNNAVSLFENDFNSVETLDELLEKRPELNDEYSKNSLLLKKGGMYFDKAGKRIGEDIKVAVVEGHRDDVTGKGTKIGRVNIGNRNMLMINQNLNGVYYILVPADAATEWAMKMGNHIHFEDMADPKRKWKDILNIFHGYLTDDIALALDWKNRSRLKNITATQAKELRFFKDILSDRDESGTLIPSKVLEGLNDLIQKDSSLETINEYVAENLKVIDENIKEFINETVGNTRKALEEQGKITSTIVNDETFYMIKELDSNFVENNNIEKTRLTSEQVDDIITYINANYVINNIEFYKVTFGDPYQMTVDRVKSFLSPAQETFDSPLYNSWLNREYNKVGDVQLEEGELGHHTFKSYTSTATLSDVIIETNNFEGVNEADAFSLVIDNTYREIKLKHGQWTPQAEKWHQWQLAWTRQNLPGYKYKSEQLRKHDEKLLTTPEPPHTIDVVKPIVRGVANNSLEIHNVLDKFAQMPLYYKVAKDRNLGVVYEKMWKEGIGYTIMESGRKAGATSTNSIYNLDGTLNTNPFEGIIEVPWRNYSIQVETSYDKPKQQTRGSQLTKLASLDLFKYGKPISEKAGEAYARNKEALRLYHEHAYQQLMRKLGIEDMGTHYDVDPQVIQETLEHEMLRRELSENAIDTIQTDENGEWRIPFEASSAYKQIKDILYSIINKTLVSPKMTGGSKVQVPVTLWESSAKGRELVIKDGDKYKKITRDEYNSLSEEDKKKVRLTSNHLKFYEDEDGKRYMEVMVPHWFRSKFSKKFKTDEQLMSYLNTKEGRRILTGIGFRIPTQAMASVDIFVVKEFLPAFMGDTVVVPSEITGKTGSDFDIDKFNMYLKSIYVDKKGDIKLVTYKGSEEATKQFFSDNYTEVIGTKIAQVTKHEEFRETLYTVLNKMETISDERITEMGELLPLTKEEINFYDRYTDTIDQIIEQADDKNILPSQYLQEQIDRAGQKEYKLAIQLLDNTLRDEYVNSMYTKALENEYYESLEQMIGLVENYKRLITSIDEKGLKPVAQKLDKLRGVNDNAIKNKHLDRDYMTKLRHAYLSAKNWIGIAAVNITGQSLSQKANVYLDKDRINALSKFERSMLKDGEILLPHNKDEQGRASLSGDVNIDGEYISDRLSRYITSFVDVKKDPYIMRVIQSENVVNTFMFLERIGAGETGVMFMNQPIITEYLKYLSNTGTKGLFSKANIDYIRSRFAGPTVAFDPKNFESNIEAYYKGELTEQQKGEQLAIFDEFLKYAMMAKYLGRINQAINYDTTKYRGSESFDKKETRTDIAELTNIFTGIDEMLENSFIGQQAEMISDAIDAMSGILKFEDPQLRQITNEVIEPYQREEFMRNDEFDRVAAKLKSSFFDYVVQTKLGLNTRIHELMIDPNTSVASRLVKAKDKYPNLAILNHLTTESRERGTNHEEAVKTVRLKVNIKNAYDENLFTDMMRELRGVDRALYDDLINLVIIQGSYQSSVSIKNIIPVEDYSARVKPVIETLISTPEVQAFANGWFQRNNFRDETIVPTYTPKVFTNDDYLAVDRFGNEITFSDIYAFKNAIPILNTLNVPKETLYRSRMLMLVNENFDSSTVNYDVIKVPRLLSVGNEKIDVLTGKSVSKAAERARILKGDYSYYGWLGYQKVKFNNGEAVTTLKGEHVYKLVNLYGDGQYASEYYNSFQKSVINNNTLKVENELSDNSIIDYFGGEVQNTSDDTDLSIKMLPTNIKKIKAGTKTITNRTQRFVDGVYTLPDNSKINLKYLGTFSVLNETSLINKDTNVTISKDEFAKAEGFQDWKDFVANDRFSSKFIQGKEARYVYSVSSVTEEAVETVEEIQSPETKQESQTGEQQFVQYGTIYRFILEDGKPVEGYYMQMGKEEKPLNPKNIASKYADLTSSAEIDKTKESKINIYYGSNENRDLSNFAIRPFTFNVKDQSIGDVEFQSVEQAFQWMKGVYTNNYEIDPSIPQDEAERMVREANQKDEQIQQEILKTTDGVKLKRLGKTFPNLEVGIWDMDSSKIMKDLILASFQQNPNALQKLLATGDATLTHTQDKTKWKEEFPRILMEVRDELSKYEGESEINILETRSEPLSYTEGQRNALLDIQDMIDQDKQAYYLLAGYAGTGKTTVVENIVNYAKSKGREAIIMAPTNKAVKVLHDKLKATGTNVAATTIHRAIYGEPDPLTGEWVPKTRITNSVIIVDESSMITTDVMTDLLENTTANNIIVLMGDRFQLEPVGRDPKLFTGGVKEFRDNRTELTEVKRQSLDSNVLKVATLVRTDNKGYIPSKSMQDFKVVNSKSDFVKDYRESVRKAEDSVMIVATNNERIAMNNVARIEKFGTNRGILESGETLISVANSSNYANSETFKASEINSISDKYTLTFTLNDRNVKYDMYIAETVDENGIPSKLFIFPALDRPSLYHSQVLDAIQQSNRELYDELDNGVDIVHKRRGGAKLSPSIVIGTYGYAITVHKSQGSQWDKVFVNQNYVAPTWNGARWWYTAITRSSREVVAFPSRNNTKIDASELSDRIDRIATPDGVLTEAKPTTGETIETFYNSLSAQQQKKLGTLESLIQEYNEIPFTFTHAEFIESLKCRI